MKLLGTIPDEKEALNNISNGLDITCFISSSAVIGMLEGPQALPALRLAISISISVAVTGKIKKLSGFNTIILLKLLIMTMTLLNALMGKIPFQH